MKDVSRATTVPVSSAPPMITIGNRHLRKLEGAEATAARQRMPADQAEAAKRGQAAPMTPLPRDDHEGAKVAAAIVGGIAGTIVGGLLGSRLGAGGGNTTGMISGAFGTMFGVTMGGMTGGAAGYGIAHAISKALND